MSPACLRFVVGSILVISSVVTSAQPNIRVHPSSSLHQFEVKAAVVSTDPQRIFLTANIYNNSGAIGYGVYGTSNGGENWSGTERYPGIPPFSFFGSFPVIGLEGNFYLYGSPNSTDGGVAISTDLGANWSFPHQITTGDCSGIEACVNDVPASPYLGRQYAFWEDFSLASPLVTISHSTDNALTWTTPMTISPAASGHYQSGADGAVGANGDVYVCWANPQAGAPSISDLVGFAKSTDGGTSWSGSTSVYPCDGIRGTIASKGIRVDDFPRIGVDRSGGSRNGWIYIVTPEITLAPAGNDPDIVLHRSTDGGTSWSEGIRVNQDGLNNGKNQYFPSVAVDDSGWVNVVYYDDRNTASDSAEVYRSRSTDGGATWVDTVVSDHRFKPRAIPGLASGYSGERTSVVAGAGTVRPFWTDESSGMSQVWTVTLPLVTGVGSCDTQLPYSYGLEQNYPNPFNPRTSISFTLSRKAHVRLAIYDVIGREVELLVDEVRDPGKYDVQLDATREASGIYFCRMETAGYVAVKKMVLIK